MRDPKTLIMSIDEAVARRSTLRSEGKKLAVTNGCFDILHRGHAEYLYRSRCCADALYVLINSDASVQELKGPSRPVNDEYARCYMLASLECVDGVIVFNSQRCTGELAALQPDVYVKGGDYTVETLDPDERQALLDCRAEFKFISFVDGYSSSSLIDKMQTPE